MLQHTSAKPVEILPDLLKLRLGIFGAVDHCYLAALTLHASVLGERVTDINHVRVPHLIAQVFIGLH